MYPRTVMLLMACASFVQVEAQFYEKLVSYAKILSFKNIGMNETGNDLWYGILRDCKDKVTFSCIQKNAYGYLDRALIETDNITVFDGLILTKNNLNYGTCARGSDPRDSVNDNIVEDSGKNDCEPSTEDYDEEKKEEGEEEEEEGFRNFKEPVSPLEEITNALQRKTMKFLVTKDYEIQLPQFYFEGATVKISPREVDDNGALVRIDFGQRAVQNEGRIFIFKKIKKFIQSKLLTSFLVLLLIIKLIKIKFMFVVPFLFGIGAAKKLFLKMLLFFIPAFAHVFKLCSSYYTSHGTKFYHHHHQIAHHHHHVPVPVPIPAPAYYDHHPHSHSLPPAHAQHHEGELDGYEYNHPHIQYRKDMEELKEWGIEPHAESSANIASAGGLAATLYPTTYGLSQYASNARPMPTPFYQDKLHPAHAAHNLAYSAYVDDIKSNRRPSGLGSVSTNPVNHVTKNHVNNLKTPYTKNIRLNGYPPIQKLVPQQSTIPKSPVGTLIVQRSSFDDDYYGPIIARLEEIFTQLKFFEEPCRERLICSMYKNPVLYSPHSNLVSNELSRDSQEIQNGSTNSESSKKFHKYLRAARLGQDGGDCLKTYHCHVATE